MCVYFVAMLCVDSFGLGWAYDVFKFAHHMLIHFNAYVPSFIYIHICYCVGTFLIVSFFLFLFLVLVCSMAPKCKSTSSQSPLHSKASSSSDPTPSSIRFHDDEARKDFLENFCRQGIHSERQVILLDFSNTDLPTVIHSKG